MGFSYNQLLDMAQSWVEEGGTEYTARFADFVKLAEARLITDLNLEHFDQRVTAVVSGGSGTVSKPVGWISTRALWLVTAGRRTAILKRSRDWCTNYYPDPSLTGTPKYYYEQDESSWRVAPAPVVSATLDATIIKRPTPMSPSLQNTWLGDNVGDLLFSCILMESEHWTKADDRYADMKAKYDETMQIRRMELRNLLRDGGEYSPLKGAATVVGKG